jgi:hypothetical protein
MTTNDKLEFIFAMAKHSNVTLHDCKRLMRYAATHHRLAEDSCNREWTDQDESKKIRVRKSIQTIIHSHGARVLFNFDPRGCTVKIQVPDGFTNDFGGEGICIPS